MSRSGIATQCVDHPGWEADDTMSRMDRTAAQAGLGPFSEMYTILFNTWVVFETYLREFKQIKREKSVFQVKNGAPKYKHVFLMPFSSRGALVHVCVADNR